MTCDANSIKSKRKPSFIAFSVLFRSVGRGVSLLERGHPGFNAFAHLFYRAIEKCRPSFDHDALNAELRCECLRLKPLLRVVSREHLLDKGAVAFADLDSRIAFIANDRRPGNMLGFE